MRYKSSYLLVRFMGLSTTEIGKPLLKASGIRLLTSNEKKTVVELGAGSYSFEVSGNTHNK